MKRLTLFLSAIIIALSLTISCYSDAEAVAPDDNDNKTEELPFNKYTMDDMTVYKFFLSGQNYVVVRSADGVSVTKE